jgi:hypothetical protein
MIKCWFNKSLVKLFSWPFPSPFLAIWAKSIDFGLIWPDNPLPVLYCLVAVLFCKVHSCFMMSRLEIGSLFLSNCLQACLFKDISNSLIGDGGALDLFKPSGNLGSCFCFFRSKKISGIIYIIGGKLGRMASRGLWLVWKVLFSNAGYCSRADRGCSGNFLIWMASLKKRNNILDLVKKEDFYNNSGKEEAVVWGYLYQFWVYYMLHDVYT